MPRLWLYPATEKASCGRYYNTPITFCKEFLQKKLKTLLATVDSSLAAVWKKADAARQDQHTAKDAAQDRLRQIGGKEHAEQAAAKPRGNEKNHALPQEWCSKSVYCKRRAGGKNKKH